MIQIAFLTSAKLSEVFCSLWNLLCEYLEDDSALLVSFLAFFANFDIEEALGILWVESREIWVILCLLCFFFFCVDTLFEETIDNFLANYALSFLVFLDRFR